MEKILYLVHRIPYPPNKGDKIRSFNILRALAKKYKVYLASFIDDPDDIQHGGTVESYCEDVYLEPMSPKYAKIRSLKGLLRSTPLTLDYYYSKPLQKWVDRIIKENDIKKVLVFSSSMAQYIEGKRFKSLKRIIDFVDIDSDKWNQYSTTTKWPLNWVYKREAKFLGKYEHRIAGEFDYSLFVSSDEASHFMKMHGYTPAEVDYFDNGVDTNYFAPGTGLASPYNDDEKVIVFAGAMDYWANVDAVVWFATHIYPSVKNKFPGALFYIVGTNPTEQVRALSEIEGVYVTGRVDDIRSYIEHADCSVAPLRIARGVQNKVLEAMSMGKPVIASPEALEGIDVCPGAEIDVAKDEEEYVAAIEKALGPKVKLVARHSRDCMVNRYGWDATLKKLLDVLA